MKKLIISALLVSLFAMGGCATTEKVQPVQLGDHELSCQQIQAEMTKLDDSQAKVEGNKGVNGTNVAAAVAWLPGLAYTYYDASKATEAISARRSHLVEMFENKSCKMVKAKVPEAAPAAPAAVVSEAAVVAPPVKAKHKKAPAKVIAE